MVRLIVMDGLKLAAAGAALGALAAVGLTRAMTAVLYGVSPLDPVAFIAGGSVLAAAVLAANVVPARRAARVDPITALRFE